MILCAVNPCDADTTTENRCLNGGTCEVVCMQSCTPDDFECVCTPQYTGRHCESGEF